MNIFYINESLELCAQQHADKHVVKMIIEYSQLLSTAHRVLDGTEYTDFTANGRRIKRWRLDDDKLENSLYKATHINHPSAIWCRENKSNYYWLANLFSLLCEEYRYRYGKTHACERLSSTLALAPKNIPAGDFFPPTPAMPVHCKVLAANPVSGRKCDVLESYRKYYIMEKKSFAKWKNRNTPEWFANASLSIS